MLNGVLNVPVRDQEALEGQYSFDLYLIVEINSIYLGNRIN